MKTTTSPEALRARLGQVILRLYRDGKFQKARNLESKWWHRMYMRVTF